MEDHANHKYSSMLAQNKNTEDIRQDDRHDDHHRASLYMDINHLRYLSSQDSTDQIKLYESPVILYEEPIQLATTLLHRKTSLQVTPISMNKHPFSPTTTTLKIHKGYRGINLSMLGKSLQRHLHVTNGNSHRLSTSKDHSTR